MPLRPVPERGTALRQQHVLPAPGSRSVVIVRVTTYTGSVYVIDYEKKTWERVRETFLSGPVRTDGHGTWTRVALPGEGYPMAIYGPPVDPAMDMRVITTSKVTSIEPDEPQARRNYDDMHP